MSNDVCIHCGVLRDKDSDRCPQCGKSLDDLTKRVEPPFESAKALHKKVDSVASELLGVTRLASASSGEMVFTHAPTLSGVLQVELGPVSYLLNGFNKLLKNTLGVFKNQKRRRIILVLSLVWLLILLLSAFGFTVMPVRFLSFLTYAQGGAGGNVASSMGGLAGKGLLTYFFTSLLIPGTTRRGSLPTRLGNGAKNIAATLSGRRDLFSLLVGTGLALACYNFLTMNNSLQNSMAGLVALVVSIRALGNKSGFLQGFFATLLAAFHKQDFASLMQVNTVMVGWATGFALGIALSVTGVNAIGYLSGALLLVIALMLTVSSRSEKKAVAQ